MQESEITFLVLHTEFPLRVGVAQAENHVADTVLFQDGGDDSGNILLLEDARVLPQGGAPQVRANTHLVGGLVQTGIPLFKAGDHTGDTAAFYPILGDRQGGGAVEYGRKVDGRIGTRQTDFQLERLGKVFIQGKIGNDKGLRR
ncbi:hypothetical protein Xedl_02982 [Xenorhabdus eapokensis]|uniref:Uncharacterized protein n=1 Tax=Xenorhabdus eapokensis TaxID=1873482 RepID=A0A1Q5TLR5_9GAMM|nr:hypothetical protein Xedl_02982 [Xenorhabdus eapokensis]